jgi:hypothetical protein
MLSNTFFFTDSPPLKYLESAVRNFLKVITPFIVFLRLPQRF